MQKSSLPNKVLGKIWRLADTDGELCLVRCHLILVSLSDKGASYIIDHYVRIYEGLIGYNIYRGWDARQ